MRRKVRIVHNVDLHAGFCALLTYGLNGIRRAELADHQPVVYFDKANVPHFYDPEYGDNIWEYFFLPIDGVSYNAIQKEIQSGLLKKEDLVYESEEKIRWGHHYDEERLATFWSWEKPKDPQKWMKEKRQLGREYVNKYVRVRPEILEKVEAFKQKHFRASYIIGIHIRGTDFSYAQPTAIENYFTEIDHQIAQNKEEEIQIFLATDQQQYVAKFEERYKGKVIYYDAIRSENDIAPFRFNESPFKKGEDVLIDILLLARTNYLIKGAAAVGETALWFNQGLACSDFGLESDFIRKKYYLHQSTYLELNVDNIHPLKLYLLTFKQLVTKIFESNYYLKPLYKFYLKLTVRKK